jgi:3-(3-hydroxy-phenyl)propionate hydroxylase
MIRFSSFLGNVIMPTNRLLAFLRDIALRTMMTLPPIASSFREMRIKPSSFYKRGFVLLNGHSLAGHLLPQPTVLLQGEQPVLLDELLSSGFTLLRLHSNPGEAFKSLQADLWSKLGLLYICLAPTMGDMQDKNVCPDVIYALDSQQQIANFLRRQRDHFVLIRPDRHILGTFRSDREQAFVSALCKHFFA